MRSAAVTHYEVIRATAVITTDSPPVNALSQSVREGLIAALNRAIADEHVTAIIVRCAGDGFYAGADIAELGRGPLPPTLQEVHRTIESAPKPIIAAIHGRALGGGLETAMVAHYRVATSSARCGLPEINLGLIPGAGGTQRLPRLVGPEKALELITSGKPVDAESAHRMGLIDALAVEGSLLDTAVAFAERAAAEGRALRKVRDLSDKIEASRGNTELFARFRQANARKFRGYRAPEQAIRAIEAAVALPFDDGIRLERRLFEELLAGPQSAAQRHVFFAERRATKVGNTAASITIPIERVGVIGAGTMGAGIAMSFLNAGMPVRIVEAQQEALDRGVASIRKLYEGSASRGKLTAADLERRMGMLSGTLDLSSIADCDLVIEAVFEQMDVKKAVFARLDSLAKPGAILASNTSYLDIDEIAAATRRPQSVVGLHFFSPANVMRLTEIVRGAATSPAIIATAAKLAKTLGKVGVIVGNGHGFVGNRMLAARQREADQLILEGALPWDVDRVLCEFGFPMGPFAMRDLAGLDIGWNAAGSASSSVREVLNERGRRGQKVGAGYYDYDARGDTTRSVLVEQIILEFAARQGISRRRVSDEEIRERCLYALVNEGARILEEGKARCASDIDVVWVLGYGWPAYRGGPLFWAEREVGLDQVLVRMKILQDQYGDAFRPAALIERLVAEGRGFDASVTREAAGN
jgi:3-hydroxyacyl-CoA dehydrogenase